MIECFNGPLNTSLTVISALCVFYCLYRLTKLVRDLCMEFIIDKVRENLGILWKSSNVGKSMDSTERNARDVNRLLNHFSDLSKRVDFAHDRLNGIEKKKTRSKK